MPRYACYGVNTCWSKSVEFIVMMPLKEVTLLVALLGAFL